MTLLELESMTLNQLLEVCNTEPQHVAYGDHITLDTLYTAIFEDPRTPEQDDMTDYLDLKRTENDCRY